MKDAATTYALVVGIDQYEVVKPTLTGAVRDAAAVVEWLRQLHVPDNHILLHASPTDDSLPDIQAVGLPYGGCKEPEIWESVEKIRTGSGSRLFVFLLGHGYYEPHGESIFLTTEAKTESMYNLGINWYARLFRGLPYRRQFIIMDGCQNLPYTDSQRSEIEAGTHTSVRPKAERTDIVQYFAYAAAQGQRASETNGRGLFTKALLETLNLSTPNPFCTRIDDTTGQYKLDLIDAINEVVTPLVQAEANSQFRRAQMPGCRQLSTGPTPTDAAVIASVEPTSVTHLTTIVTPANAKAAVERIVLRADEFINWARTVPEPGASAVQVPFTCVIPQGLNLDARCKLGAQTVWRQPPPQRFGLAQDRDLVFDLQNNPGDPGGQLLEIDVRRVDGGTVPPIDGNTREMVADAVTRAPDVELETGTIDSTAVGLALREASGPTTAEGIADIFTNHTPRDVYAMITRYQISETGDPQRIDTSAILYFDKLTRPDAIALGGFWADKPTVTIADHSYSLLELARRGTVRLQDRRAALVQLRLPWGSWSTIARVPNDQVVAPVHLPRTVGRPPLRTTLVNTDVPPNLTEQIDPDGSLFQRSTIAHRRQQPIRAMIFNMMGSSLGDLEPSKMPFRRMIPETDSYLSTGERRRHPWNASFLVPESPQTPANTIGGVMLDGSRLLFPLNPQGLLAIDIENEPRVEPLSNTNSPYWDDLVSTGQPQTILDDPESLGHLSGGNDYLLQISAAYAYYAGGDDRRLESVLDGIPNHIRRLSADIVILDHAFKKRTGRAIGDEISLERINAQALVPLFRRGVTLGILVADHYGFDTVSNTLRHIEERLVPDNAWTAWTETS